MIFLNLQDADTGYGLGSHRVANLPEAGGTFALPTGNGFIAFDVVEVFTKAGPNQFAGPDHWARLRKKS
jgi:hypothetical protein